MLLRDLEQEKAAQPMAFDDDLPSALQNQLTELRALLRELRARMYKHHNRHVPISDLIFDRWETAQFYGFGEGTSCYNSVLILGDVKVGKDCWIGPNVILDGSGGLEIGDHCSISAGVQIYTHHTVARSTTMGVAPIERAATRIGDGVYIGPNSVLQMGCAVGSRAMIGAMSFVNIDVPEDGKCFGTPARLIAG
jgi:acetyltransferase-like isoleucine patch superfamily enzyme